MCSRLAFRQERHLNNKRKACFTLFLTERASLYVQLTKKYNVSPNLTWQLEDKRIEQNRINQWHLLSLLSASKCVLGGIFCLHHDSIKLLWVLEKRRFAALGKDKGTSLFTWEQSSNRTRIRRNTVVHTPACTVALISTLIDHSEEVLRQGSTSSTHFKAVKWQSAVKLHPDFLGMKVDLIFYLLSNHDLWDHIRHRRYNFINFAMVDQNIYFPKYWNSNWRNWAFFTLGKARCWFLSPRQLRWKDIICFRAIFVWQL